MSCEPDITRRKHGGNEFSEAAQRARQGKGVGQRYRVEMAVKGARAVGLTQDELAAEWEVPQHAISGRFTELVQARRIFVRGKRPNRQGRGVGVYFHADCLKLKQGALL